MKRDAGGPGRRRTGRRRALKLLGATAAGCLIEGFWLEPRRLGVRREEIVCPGLPGSLDGLRVGVMADFHFRPGRDEALVAGAVERANREELDLVLLPGDFIRSDPRVLAPLVELLGGLRARHGVFAAMGNHDGWHAGHGVTRRAFERAGIGFPINRHARVGVRGEALAVAATDHVWLGRPDPAAALRGIPSRMPVLAMVHEPDFFDTMARVRRIDLQLSGHTHGGQCRVPFVPATPVKVRFGEKYVRGAFESGDSRLFVTQGVGTSGLRVRFACPPELAVLTLRADRHGGRADRADA